MVLVLFFFVQLQVSGLHRLLLISIQLTNIFHSQNAVVFSKWFAVLILTRKQIHLVFSSQKLKCKVLCGVIFTRIGNFIFQCKRKQDSFVDKAFIEKKNSFLVKLFKTNNTLDLLKSYCPSIKNYCRMYIQIAQIVVAIW